MLGTFALYWAIACVIAVPVLAYLLWRAPEMTDDGRFVHEADRLKWAKRSWWF